jgi:AP-3 complex subunit delta-1
MRDDPYYIVDDHSSKLPPLNDVDSIPVVRLDDLPPMPKGLFSNLNLWRITDASILDDPRLPSLRDPPGWLASQPFVVEKEGEMPQGGSPGSSQAVSRHQTPVPFERTSSPLPTSAIPPYITSDDLRTGTPEPIKVMRSKKKGTGTGKKKRIVKSGEGSGTVTPM